MTDKSGARCATGIVPIGKGPPALRPCAGGLLLLEPLVNGIAAVQFAG